jgi:hypothetical protein
MQESQKTQVTRKSGSKEKQSQSTQTALICTTT